MSAALLGRPERGLQVAVLVKNDLLSAQDIRGLGERPGQVVVEVGPGLGGRFGSYAGEFLGDGLHPAGRGRLGWVHEFAEECDMELLEPIAAGLGDARIEHGATDLVEPLGCDDPPCPLLLGPGEGVPEAVPGGAHQRHDRMVGEAPREGLVDAVLRLPAHQVEHQVPSAVVRRLGLQPLGERRRQIGHLVEQEVVQNDGLTDVESRQLGEERRVHVAAER